LLNLLVVKKLVMLRGGEEGLMSEIIVELVKYDTIKTKKRKRSNLLVSAKTEAAVIQKLEKIHKGDKIESIHEIVWGEVAEVKKEITRKVFSGVVKFYDEGKGFGFVAHDDGKEDLFFHATALNGIVLHDGDLVHFEKSVAPKGPVAVNIKLIED
jgi:CspA family cold shock protein